MFKGEILEIIGPNGSGKITLVNLITGFVKPDSGEVLFKDKKITGLQPHKIANLGITRTFQIMRPYHSLSAFKNLFERDAYVPYKTTSSLPLGYLKRLELARCIAMRPEKIICDEIFSGLSMAEIATIVPVLEKLETEGMTIMMIEHRLRELFRLVSRLIVMNFGEKLA